MNSAPALVILVPGLWMSGLQLTMIRRRLEADGALRALFFTYPTIVGSMSDHVRRLLDWVHAHPSERLHFVGHSLGGLVILAGDGDRADPTTAGVSSAISSSGRNQTR